jgi:hypothetical protein
MRLDDLVHRVDAIDDRSILGRLDQLLQELDVLLAPSTGHDRYKVRPELLRGDERAAAWKRIVAEAPQFGDYEHKTDREIPVVRVTREP